MNENIILAGLLSKSQLINLIEILSSPSRLLFSRLHLGYPQNPFESQTCFAQHPELFIMSSTITEALEEFTDQSSAVAPISVDEFQNRIARLRAMMKQNEIDAVYLHGGTNLYYFTGLQWNPSERMVAAIVPAEGEIIYIAPQFELGTVKDYWLIESRLETWEEHQSPFELASKLLNEIGCSAGTLGVDETTPFVFVDGLSRTLPNAKLISAKSLTEGCRQRKSENEIAIIRQAHKMTLQVIKSAASILRPGISTSEVAKYIDDAHRAIGASNGSYFCIVLFGVSTSFPHGVKNAQILGEEDWVLIDTGFQLNGYHSDITRTFPFGSATERQAEIWNLERQAQLAAFDAAQIGNPCEAIDAAARTVLENAGLGPDYSLPGLPHRTGHGCGLDIHESPYVVRGNSEPLEKGMVASIEPMIVMPDEFGVRLEDHFFMTETGPEWFTEPARSIDDCF